MASLETNAVISSMFGKPRNTVHMTNVQCIGDENTITECSHFLYELEQGITILEHAEVAGVNCLGNVWPFIADY